MSRVRSRRSRSQQLASPPPPTSSGTIRRVPILRRQGRFARQRIPARRVREGESGGTLADASGWFVTCLHAGVITHRLPLKRDSLNDLESKMKPVERGVE